MKGAKVGVIVGGYVAAFAVAYGAVAINDARMDPITSQGGMAAFGDSLLFLGIFAICAVPPTGYSLYLLRERAGLWRALSFAAIAIAGTGLAALVAEVTGRSAAGGTLLSTVALIAILRILIAPIFALSFAVAGLFAQGRFARVSLFGAALFEAIMFAWVFIWLLRSS